MQRCGRTVPQGLTQRTRVCATVTVCACVHMHIYIYTPSHICMSYIRDIRAPCDVITRTHTCICARFPSGSNIKCKYLCVNRYSILGLSRTFSWSIRGSRVPGALHASAGALAISLPSGCTPAPPEARGRAGPGDVYSFPGTDKIFMMISYLKNACPFPTDERDGLGVEPLGHSLHHPTLPGANQPLLNASSRRPARSARAFS